MHGFTSESHGALTLSPDSQATPTVQPSIARTRTRRLAHLYLDEAISNVSTHTQKEERESVSAYLVGP